MSKITDEIKKRRTFAIISHPDAGKTTLTEKFLLYGGAINQAGSVKGKATAKHAVSDWMEIEKERGISVTSSVLQFNYGGYCINILDTPGHQDFSEDTYRTLMAADSAVMVIDASKGVEAQTRKLFKVCVMRHIPIFTFINKMDREAMDTFELLDDIEKELGIATCPVNWPIGSGKAFRGVYDRNEEEIELFFDTKKGRRFVWIIRMWISTWTQSRKTSFLGKSSFWTGQAQRLIRRWWTVGSFLRYSSDQPSPISGWKHFYSIF